MNGRTMILGFMLLLALAGCSVGQAPAQGGEAGAGTQAPAAQENVIWASGKLLPSAVGRAEPGHGWDREDPLPGRG